MADAKKLSISIKSRAYPDRYESYTSPLTTFVQPTRLHWRLEKTSPLRSAGVGVREADGVARVGVTSSLPIWSTNAE